MQGIAGFTISGRTDIKLGQAKILKRPSFPSDEYRYMYVKYLFDITNDNNNDNARFFTFYAKKM